MTPAELSALLLRNLPAIDHRGEVVEEIGPDFVRLRIDVPTSYLSHDLPAGSGRKVLSGPVEMGFAETSMYACVHAVYGAGVLASTLQFSAMFLRAAGEGDLRSHATLLRRGKSIAFVEALLFSGSAEDPSAKCSASYSIRSLQP